MILRNVEKAREPERCGIMGFEVAIGMNVLDDDAKRG